MKTFSADAIVGLLIALGFPPFSCRFPLFLFKSVFFSVAFFSVSCASPVFFRVSLPKLSSYDFHFAISIRLLFFFDILFLSKCPQISIPIWYSANLIMFFSYYLSPGDTFTASSLLFSPLCLFGLRVCNSPLISSINPTTFPTLIVLVGHVYVDFHPIIIIHRQGAHRSHQPSFWERLP